MNEDSVVREVRVARENYARSHGFDVRKIVAELQNLDRAGDWTVVRLAPRRPQTVGTTLERETSRNVRMGRNDLLSESLGKKGTP